MKILVIGATGMIGSQVTAEAVSRGHTVTAASRKGTDVAGATALTLDFHDETALRAAADAADVVIASASPRNTDDAIAESLAYADALIAGLGSNRLVLVGGAGSLNLPDGTPVADVVPELYAKEAKGMRAAFEKIAASDLKFTVHAPAGQIAPGKRTGAFRMGGRTLLTDAEGNSNISTQDYAVALLNEVESPKHSGEIFHVAY